MANHRPNTILIGAQKAGTSSLYNWIGQHPNVHAPKEMKDFHFFNWPQLYNKGIEYLEGFYAEAKAEKIRLLGAVNYIYFAELSAQRIKEHCPDAQFIVILRNPVDRAFSAYNFFSKKGVELQSSFEAALADEKKGVHTDLEAQGRHCYVDHGFYAQQLGTFFKYFESSRFKVLLYEDMVKDKTGTLQEIFSFLGVDDTFVPEFVRVNITGTPRSKFLNKLYFGKSGWSANIKKLLPTKWIPIQWKIRINQAMLKYNTNPDKKLDTQLSAETRKQLLDVYQDDISELSKMMDRDLHQVWN
ncbi:MAG: sulfotransferase [Bacteroidota bacterium]